MFTGRAFFFLRIRVFNLWSYALKFQKPDPLDSLWALQRLYRLHLGIADGMPIARVWARRYSKWPPRRGGHFESPRRSFWVSGQWACHRRCRDRDKFKGHGPLDSLWALQCRKLRVDIFSLVPIKLGFKAHIITFTIKIKQYNKIYKIHYYNGICDV